MSNRVLTIAQLKELAQVKVIDVKRAIATADKKIKPFVDPKR